MDNGKHPDPSNIYPKMNGIRSQVYFVTRIQAAGGNGAGSTINNVDACRGRFELPMTLNINEFRATASAYSDTVSTVDMVVGLLDAVGYLALVRIPVPIGANETFIAGQIIKLGGLDQKDKTQAVSSVMLHAFFLFGARKNEATDSLVVKGNGGDNGAIGNTHSKSLKLSHSATLTGSEPKIATAMLGMEASVYINKPSGGSASGYVYGGDVGQYQDLKNPDMHHGFGKLEYFRTPAAPAAPK